jgi:predicted secreted protein with PEFG-CTERM motif
VTDKDEESYVLSENAPTTASLKKLTITASGMEGSTTINVSGTTDKIDEIIIKVTAPNGNLVSVAQITPSDGGYSTTIETGGALWSQDGMYTIKARQGPTTFNTNAVNVVDQITPSGGSYSSHKSADDENTGYLLYQASTEVEILDGHVIPEFGVIAAMILAVAIVSIIVVTAKTKLSIVPRY